MFLVLTGKTLLQQVLIGGGKNHRMGLFDMVMIKDNHISIAGGITQAIKLVNQFLEQNGLHMPVEVLLSQPMLPSVKVIKQLCVYMSLFCKL